MLFTSSALTVKPPWTGLRESYFSSPVADLTVILAWASLWDGEALRDRQQLWFTKSIAGRLQQCCWTCCSNTLLALKHCSSCCRFNQAQVKSWLLNRASLSTWWGTNWATQIKYRPAWVIFKLMLMNSSKLGLFPPNSCVHSPKHWHYYSFHNGVAKGLPDILLRSSDFQRFTIFTEQK